MLSVAVPPLKAVVPTANEASPSPADSDTYASEVNALILSALNQHPVGTRLTVVYPNGSTDEVELDEDGDIRAVSDWEIGGEDGD